MQELGLDKAAAELEALKPAKRERTKKAKSYADVLIEARRSDRARKAVNYCEEPIKLDRKRPPIDYSERIRVRCHCKAFLLTKYSKVSLLDSLAADAGHVAGRRDC